MPSRSRTAPFSHRIVSHRIAPHLGFPSNDTNLLLREVEYTTGCAYEHVDLLEEAHNVGLERGTTWGGEILRENARIIKTGRDSPVVAMICMSSRCFASSLATCSQRN